MRKNVVRLDNSKKAKVEQLYNKNQFVIFYSDGLTAFQSYNTIICIFDNCSGKLYINWHYWDYSKTTSKHLKIFINEYTCYNYESKNQFLKFLMSDNENVILFEE